MKRFLYLMMILLVIFILTSCKTEEKAPNYYFDEWLENKEGTESASKDKQEKEEEKGNAPQIEEVEKEEEKQPSKEEKEEQTEQEPVTKPGDNKPLHLHVFSEATCTQPQKCECGITLGDPLGHRYAEAVCGETTKCSVCGVEGIKAEHNWLDATCERSKMCTNCSETEGSPLPHNFSDATCTAPKTCSICGLTEGAPLAEHQFLAANCVSPKICSSCGANEGTALGHDYSAKTCSRCGVQNYAELCELGKKYQTPSGLEITLNSFTREEYEGYTEYKIAYTLENNVPDSKIGEATFELYLTDGTRKGTSGWLENLYYKDVVNRECSFKLLENEKFAVLEYYGLDSEKNFQEYAQYTVFDKKLVYNALHWVV